MPGKKELSVSRFQLTFQNNLIIPLFTIASLWLTEKNCITFSTNQNTKINYDLLLPVFPHLTAYASTHICSTWLVTSILNSYGTVIDRSNKPHHLCMQVRTDEWKQRHVGSLKEYSRWSKKMNTNQYWPRQAEDLKYKSLFYRSEYRSPWNE